AHHAFPAIPSERLPLATRRIAMVLERHGAPPLPTLPSYGEALRVMIADQNNPGLSSKPSWQGLINEIRLFARWLA
ncbi:MAG: hypothetical protein VKK63_04665, partial [Synechococcus sp.]|nr:hypothetical protein [Synechococcus sp.]